MVVVVVSLIVACEVVATATGSSYAYTPAISEIDWSTKSAVTKVKDQGSRGSCWASSAVGGLEGQWQIATTTLQELSEQQLVDRSKQDDDGAEEPNTEPPTEPTTNYDNTKLLNTNTKEKEEIVIAAAAIVEPGTGGSHQGDRQVAKNAWAWNTAQDSTVVESFQSSICPSIQDVNQQQQQHQQRHAISYCRKQHRHTDGVDTASGDGEASVDVVPDNLNKLLPDNLNKPILDPNPVILTCPGGYLQVSSLEHSLHSGGRGTQPGGTPKSPEASATECVKATSRGDAVRRHPPSLSTDFGSVSAVSKTNLGGPLQQATSGRSAGAKACSRWMPDLGSLDSGNPNAKPAPLDDHNDDDQDNGEGAGGIGDTDHKKAPIDEDSDDNDDNNNNDNNDNKTNDQRLATDNSLRNHTQFAGETTANFPCRSHSVCPQKTEH